jgi:hypothetical protein
MTISSMVFATPWRLLPAAANRQPAFACYQADGERFRLGAVNVLSLWDGRISWIAGFLDPQVHRRFSIPLELVGPDR